MGLFLKNKQNQNKPQTKPKNQTPQKTGFFIWSDTYQETTGFVKYFSNNSGRKSFSLGKKPKHMLRLLYSHFPKATWIGLYATARKQMAGAHT